MDIKKLISEMTLEEKAGLCSGADYWRTKAVGRLGIPSIMMTDGPHGLRKVSLDTSGDSRGSNPATCFPPAALSACSFDRELLFSLGQAIADEAEAEDVRIVLGPGVNIKRSPLCGRNFEYFSEDPYLAGEMAASFIKGVESKGIGTSLKHYAANNQETRRWSSDSRIDERTLREIYLPAFKKAVQEGKPATLMCSYNRINGEYGSENKYLLTEILRDEWGFEGIVMSDWGAVNDRVKGLKAGLELEMPGVANPSYDEKIAEAVRSGKLEESVLDTAVERLLKIICRYGCTGECCENGTAVKKAAAKIDVDAHDKLGRRIAAESIVLLKNDKNLLPLDKKAKIAFIGEMASKPRYQGAGSSQVNSYKITSALEAASEYAEVTYARGYISEDCDSANEALQEEAVKAAGEADVCVIFAGLPAHYESEGYDRTHMRIPGGHNELIKAVLKANPNAVVVLSNGAPVEMPWADDVPSIVEAYLGGQAGGGAIADVLFGAANPCGKLAETLPVKLSDNPSYLYYIGERDTVEYREGIFVGYRYYDAKEMDVRFPFGHGLSYTSFEYSDIKLSADKIRDTDTLTVTADVKNTGDIAGKEIVQLYTGPAAKDDRLIRADKELRDFVKVELAPGEKKQVTFKLSKEAFSYYNTQISDFHVLGGDYIVMLGKSSRDIQLEATVNVQSTVEIPFKADENTTVRDIRRMKNGKAFLEDVVKRFPQHFYLTAEVPPASDPNYGWIVGGAEMVMRQVRLMGGMPDISIEDVKAWIDEKLND